MKLIAATSVMQAPRRKSWVCPGLLLLASMLIAGCETTTGNGSTATPTASAAKTARNSEDFFIVDCLLPGQVRQLGGKYSYVTQRRPIKTAQSDCEIRGGEYVAYDRADYSTALRIWLPLAETGDPAAQTYVGEIYEKGLGLSADYEVAAHWYAQAAAQGYSRANINLGHLYEVGLGVRQDKQKALNLYRRASGIKDDKLLYASTLSSVYVPRQQHEDVQRQLATQQRRASDLERQLDAVDRQLRQQESALAGAESQLRDTSVRLENALAASTAGGGGEQTEQARQLTASVARMEDDRRELETELSQLRRQNEELTRSKRALVQQLSGNELARDRYRAQIDDLESELASSKTALQRSGQALAEVRAELSREQARAETVSPQLVGLQRQLDASKQSLAERQVREARLDSERRALGQRLVESDRRIQDYEQQNEVMTAALASARRRVAESEKEIEALNQALQVQRSTEAEITPALRTSQRELAARQQQLEEQRREYVALSLEKEQLASQLAATEQRRQDDGARVEQLQQQLGLSRQALGDSQGEVVALREELARMQARDEAVTPELKALQARLEEQSRVHLAEQVEFARLETQGQVRQQELTEALAELDEKTARLREAERNYNSQIAALTGRLEGRQQELDDARHQLLLAQAALHMERARGEQALAAQADAHEKAAREQQGELARLTSQLETQLALVASKEGEIRQLQSQQDSYEIKLAGLDKTVVEPRSAATIRDGMPAIEIIEPPVVLTRSQATVKIRTFQGQRQVVGKVIAPSGLLSLSVNGQTPALTANNLFHSSIPLTENPTPVEVVLIDQQGRRAAVSFAFTDRDVGGTQADPSSRPNPDRPVTPGINAKVPMGNYHALIIGNNEYQNFSTLQTAVNDATEAERVLRTRYGFKTTLLLNADRYTMLSAFNKLRETLGEQDNLLVYYAGHGKLDDSTGEGFWLPVDAEQGNSINWVSNTVVTNILNVIEAKHILVVADSCYAGTLTQTPIARVENDIPADVRSEWIKVMAETRARITLTSGGVEPVLDGGGGRHSIFARAFLEALQDNQGMLEGYTLYSRVLDNMSRTPSPLGQAQVPQYVPIHLAGHESGEFFFSPSG